MAANTVAMLYDVDIRATLAQVQAAMKAVDDSDILTTNLDFVVEGQRLRREREVKGFPSSSHLTPFRSA